MNTRGIRRVQRFLFPDWLFSFLEIWGTIYWIFILFFGTFASVAVAYIVSVSYIHGFPLWSGPLAWISGNVGIGYSLNKAKDAQKDEAFDDRLPREQRLAATDWFVNDAKKRATGGGRQE